MAINLLWKTTKLIWQYSKLWLILSLIFTILLGLIPTSVVWITKYLIENITYLVSGDSSKVNVIIWILLLQLVLLMSENVLQQFKRYIDEQFKLKLNGILISKITQKAYRLKYSSFENPKLYNQLDRIKTNVSANLISPIENLFNIIQSIITLITIGYFLLTIHWILSVLSISGFIPVLLLKAYLGNKNFKYTVKLTPVVREYSYIESLMLEKNSSKEIRSFNLYPYLHNKWKKAYNLNVKETLELIKVQSKVEVLLSSLTIVNYTIGVGLTIKFIKNSFISVGDFVAVGQAFVNSQDSMNEISSNLASIYENLLFIDDYFVFMDSEEEATNEQVHDFPISLNKGIEFKNVSVSYPETNKNALDSISFFIKKGESIAIVGHNGSGKSTLIKTLLGLYNPHQGNIFFDEIPIKLMNMDSLRNNITVIYQDFIRYFFTVEENIYFSNVADTDMNKVVDSAIKAGIHNTIISLPLAYKTYLGRYLNSGVDLSGGEWQKIALARALFKDSQVIILDEPTAALDPLAEKKLFTNFKNLTEGKTSIIVSHRMSVTKIVDKVIVLDKGKIVEVGSHFELLEKNEIYADLYYSQANTYEQEVFT